MERTQAQERVMHEQQTRKRSMIHLERVNQKMKVVELTLIRSNENLNWIGGKTISENASRALKQWSNKNVTREVKILNDESDDELKAKLCFKEDDKMAHSDFRTACDDFGVMRNDGQ